MSWLWAITGLQREGARAVQRRTATAHSDRAQRSAPQRPPHTRAASCSQLRPRHTAPHTVLPPTPLLHPHPGTCAAPLHTRSGGAPSPGPSAHPPAQAPLQRRRRDRAGSFRRWFAREGRRAGGRHGGRPTVKQCALCSPQLQLRQQQQQQQHLLGFTRQKKCSPCPPPQCTQTDCYTFSCSRINLNLN